MVHAFDDRGAAGVGGSIELARALNREAVQTEYHIYSRGGHGFGILDRGVPASSWAERLAEWLKT